MDFFDGISLSRIFVVTTILSVVSFFLLLVVANVTGRKGIEEIGAYQKEIRQYESKIAELEAASATYSSLLRIENKAKEMGFEPAKKVEYLK